MKAMKGQLAMLMGVVIAIVDIYWTYVSLYYPMWVALGAIIFIADMIWLYLDWSMMK